jgi:hypothetical protein
VTEVRRGFALLLLATLVAAPAAAARRPSPFARTVSCNVGEVTIAYDGKTVVVEGRHQTLGRASRLTRSTAKSCIRAHHFGVARHLLDHNNPTGRRTQLVCRAGSPTFVEVEPVRNSSYRIIGSRLAVWQSGFAGEMAEAMLLPSKSWFSWSSLSCRLA